MPNYDFKSLSPIDFEVLVRDLLQEELHVRLESFRSGRDLGIDFRYSPDAGGEIVVQCKHYADSRFAKLLSDLRKRELPKIKRLAPTRYIIGTSLGLNPTQKDQIAESLRPFLQRRDDIFGKDDLNNLLQRFPAIERQTFKLWVSSVPILEEILHSKVKNASRDELEKIIEHARYYVQNDSFTEAMRILRTSNLCIIVGIPGIGKTILAEMLLLHFVDLGYEIVKVTEDIAEAIGLGHKNEKRVFYYDDFLGQTPLSPRLNKNEDQRLIDFIDAIRRSKRSKLILTTREYILNQARSFYEKIARSNFEGETCVVELSKYTRMNRAKILYNHLFFSDAADEFKASMLQQRSYLRIIDHKNYNPRIVDLMTQRARLQEIDPKKYIDFFVANLENPSEIWRHAFDSHLSQAGKDILIVLGSLPTEVFLEDLEDAFSSFHAWLGRAYGIATAPSDFRQGLKELDGDLISTSRSNHRIIVQFRNPSVRDFIENHLAASKREFTALVNSIYFFEQLKRLWGPEESDVLRQVYRSVMSQDVDAFLLGLRRTIGSRDCRLIIVQEPGHLPRKDIWKTSFESRASFVVAVFRLLRDQDTSPLLDYVLSVVQERVASGAADREDLIALLKTLRDLKLLPAEHPLFIKTKNMFMARLYWPQDFQLFCGFMREFPYVVQEDDLNVVREKFQQFVSDELPTDSTDPEEITTDIYIIEEVAGVLGIDASEQIESLEAYAEHLREEEPSEEPDDDDDGERWRPSHHEPESDGDIDSLFSTLDVSD